jgi:hypothetical protein
LTSARDQAGLSIATRLPEADDHEVMGVTRVVRLGGGTIGSAAPPPEVLLPSGGSAAPVPVPAPSRVLALDALRLRRRIGSPSGVPDGWADPAFEDEVSLVRTHLAPLRTRRALAQSFAREAFRIVDDPNGPEAGAWPGPVRAAYALRWLELGR